MSIREYTMTAMDRPELIRWTLESFKRNLIGADFASSTLYLTVTPIKGREFGRGVEVLAREYFGHVITHRPETFGAAVKWCWSQPSADFFLHMEDDWLLLHPVSLASMLDMLGADDKLSAVNIRAYNHPRGSDRINLAAALLRTAHARVMSLRMDATKNPEQQLRPFEKDMNPEGGVHEGFHGTFFPDKPVITDTGRPWREANGYQRDGGPKFNSWV